MAGQKNLSEPTLLPEILAFLSRNPKYPLKDISSPVSLSWFAHCTQALVLISQVVSGDFQIQRDSFDLSFKLRISQSLLRSGTVVHKQFINHTLPL